MTQISRDDVLRAAQLSSIALSDDEIVRFETDLPRIISYVEQLNELDTENVEPTFQLNHRSNEWREDSVEPSLSAEELLALAPKQRANHIEVPKVL